MTKKRTAEQATADVVLNNPTEVKLGGKTYEVKSPTISTLILASKYIGDIPKVSGVNNGNYLSMALNVARECEELPYIFAVFLLGYKAIQESTQGIEGKLRSLFKCSKLDRLAQKISNEATPKELSEALKVILGDMQLAFFLSTISFLSEVNLLRPTRIETTEVTQFGQ